MSLKNVFKKNFASVFYSFSCNLLVQRLCITPHSFVLMYHRVISSSLQDDCFVQPGMRITERTFWIQSSFLKSRFQIVSFVDLLERLRSGRSIDGYCAITFDDGWLDNYTCAFPVLQELQLPATIFLATGLIGTDRLFWPEELSSYLQRIESVDKFSHDKIMRSILGNVPDNPEERLDMAIMALKSWEPQRREDFLAELRQAHHHPASGRMLMNWDEVREMQSSGLIEFGAHSHNHVMLDQVSLAEAEQEIKLSRDEIERQLGVAPTLFAYPNGNYTPELEALLMRHGFKAAVTTRKDWFKKGVSPFAIPRIGMHEDVSSTIPLFFTRIHFKRF